MKQTALIFYCISLLITGCSLYEKPVVPPVTNPNKFKYAINVTHPEINYYWWENFHDPKLNQLVTQALQQNYNYQITLKNIEIAKTYVTQYESGLFPQLNLNANSSRNKALSLLNSNASTKSGSNLLPTGTFNIQQISGSLSYELDVWNQIGNSVNQAKASVASSKADSDVAKLILISSVANTYFQIKDLNSQALNLEQQSRLSNKLLNLTQAQFDGKIIDITTLSDAKNQDEAVKINLELARKQQQILTNTLAYLLGTTPEDFSLQPQQPLTTFNYANLVPAGLPSSMVANRPDIQSAYYQVMSYGYLEKQTLANFLPSFNLTANYGYASRSLAQFFTPNNSFWNYGLGLLQPVFDYKLRYSEYERSKLQFDASVLNYKNTVINAYQEVDNSLISYQKDSEALLAYQNEARNFKDKYNAALAQHKSGLGDYSTYLNDKLQYLQSTSNLLNQQLLLLQDVIQLYQALGLGLCTENCPKL